MLQAISDPYYQAVSVAVTVCSSVYLFAAWLVLRTTSLLYYSYATVSARIRLLLVDVDYQSCIVCSKHHSFINT